MRVGPQTCGSTLMRGGLKNQPANFMRNRPTRPAFCGPSAGTYGQPTLLPLILEFSLL